MKSKTDKRLLSKLIAATLMGTVGLSMYSVSAADPAESLPLGEGSSATHESVAIGTNAQATTSSNAIGIGAKASGSSSVLGNGAQAVAGGVAIGKEAVAGIGKEGSNEIIVGDVAVGQSANAALGGIAIGSSATTKNISDVVIGSNSKNNGAGSTIIGYGTEGNRSSVVVGTNSKAGLNALSIGYEAEASQFAATALGSQSKVTAMQGVALGSSTVADTASGKTGYLANKTQTANVAKSVYTSTNGAVSVGKTNEITRQITNVAAGTEDTDVVNVRQLKDLDLAVDNKISTQLSAVNTQLDGKLDADALQYVSIKSTETGTGSNEDNLGANGANSIAIGPKAVAKYTADVAMGLNANAHGFYSIALGRDSETTGSSSVAVGDGAKSKTNETVAIGKKAITNSIGSISIGKDATTATDSMAAMAIGYETNATGVAATAMGAQAKALSKSATAVGFDAVIQNASNGSGRTGNNAVAMGVSSKVDGGNGGIAIGNNANVIDTNQATVVGTGAMVSALPENSGDSVVITDGSSGTKTITKGDDGTYTVVPTKDSVESLKQRNGNAYGATALGSRATAHNLGAVAAGLYATAIGVGNKIMGGTTNTSNNAVLLGTSSSITEGQSSLLLGNKASINKSQNAVGVGSQSSIKNSMAGTAVGYLAIAKDAEQGTAIGGGSIVSAKQATAVGGSSEVSAAQGVAIGYKSNAGVAHGVALGTYSQATRANNYMGYNPLTGTVMENDEAAIAKVLGREADLEAYNATMQNSDPKSQEYLEAKTNKEILLSAYKSGMSAVSVGRVNLTRQITNVAAGTADTDAVNVAQLKAAKVEVAAGANVTVDTDTSLGYTKYTVNSVDTDTKLVDGTVTYGNDGVGSITLNTEQNGTTGTVSVTGLHDKYITGASMTGNTLTINRNDGENFTVTNIATKDDVNTAAGSKIDTFTVGTDAAAQANGIDVDKENTRFDILGANENITTEIAGRQVKIGLANTLNLTDAGSISFGNGANAAKVDASGLTISEQLKFTNDGISAGNQTIDNVKSAISDKAGTQFTDKLNAANESNPNSAVNVSDLKQTAEALTGQIGDANTAANSKLESFVVGADKNSTAAGITVDKGTEGKTNRFDIVGADENITTKVNGNTIEVGLAKDITLNDGSVTTTKDGVTTKVDGTGVTITPSNGDASKSVSLTNEGLNNGGNKITNVADGDVSASSKDAVNGSQLHAVKEELKGDINDLESKLGAAGDLTKVDQNGNPVVTGNDGKNYNPSDVDENGNPKDGAKPVESTLGSGADTSGLGLDNKDNSKPITEQEAKDIVGGTPGADGQPGKDGLLDKTGPSLSNLATIKDLQAVAQAGLDFGSDTGDTAHRALSQKLTINGGISNEEQLTDNNIGVVSNGSDTLTVKLAKDINLGKDGSVTTGNTTINNDGLTVKGEDGKPGTTVGSDGMVVNGDDGKPATTVGKDGISTNGKDGISVNGEDGSSTTIKPDGVTSKDPNGNSTVFGPNGVEVKDKDGNTVVTINDQGISNSNGGPTNLNDGLNVPGGLVVTPGKEVNGQYVPGSISAEGNRIQNVAPGIEATDAVNVGQLGGVKRDLSNRMNTIGAHAAAMAALHPMEYLEDEKLSVAAGVGTFHSKQAVAVGAFYRPNDDTMFSVGGSFGGSENMFNLGVSLRVGQDSDYAKAAQNYKQAPLSTMTVLDEKVTNLEKENAALKGQLEEQREQIKLLMERLGV